MLKDADRITTLQMFVLIVSTINAIEVLILPRTLASDIGPDGWVVIIGGHLISAVGVFFIVKLGLLYPRETFADYAPKILGRFIGVPVVIFAILMWMLLVSRIVREFADFIQLILPQTPIETIILTMLLAAAYVARHGIEPIARSLEILFPIFIALIGFLTIIAAFDVEAGNLLPLLHCGFKKLALSSVDVAFGHEGQEIALMLLPFMYNPGRAYKAVYAGLLCNLIIRVIIFVTTVGVFGVELVKILVWPVEELSRSLAFAGGNVGRIDSVFTALWITVVFSSILVFMYLACLALSRLMGFKEHLPAVMPLVPIIFIISLVPGNIVETEKFSDYLSVFMGTFTFAVPPLLLAVSYIRGTHRRNVQERQRGR